MPLPSHGITPDVIRDVTPPSTSAATCWTACSVRCRHRRQMATPTWRRRRTAALPVQRQKKPVRFYGTEVEDAVDVAAVDEVWCSGTLASAGLGG
jgi:hypothetical protein